MAMNKKEFSAKQEKMVADYMGWRVVTGSGSRPFTPGDVNSYNFLVECKTHVKPQDNIVFYKNHWHKIFTEAQGVHRFPALVTDNGTQQSKYTWVAIPQGALPDGSHEILGWKNTSRSNNTITFDSYDTMELFRAQYVDGEINHLSAKFDQCQIAIMPLNEFREFYHRGFET